MEHLGSTPTAANDTMAWPCISDKRFTSNLTLLTITGEDTSRGAT